MIEKAIDKKRSIGDAAKEIGVKAHVIRFWESKFPQIKPQIGKGSRRYYFNQEIAVLNKVKSLLHEEGYSIAGLQKLLKKRKKSDLKEQNIEFLLTTQSEKNPEDETGSSLDFSLDDFITPSANSSSNLDQNSTSTINQIINRIEANLKTLEQ